MAVGLAAAGAAGCSPSDDDPGVGDTGRRDDGAGGDFAADADADADPDVLRDDGGGDVVEEVDGECVQDLDIVFVLDVSTSMTPILGALRDGIADVWSHAQTMSPDPQFGLVVFVDDVRVTIDGSPWGTVAALQGEFDHWRGFCSSNDEPGGSGGFNTDCPENTLDALWAAATSFPWRPDSLRVIILATDDTFVEYPGTLGSARIVVERFYGEVLDELRAREIRLAAFTADDSANCSIPPVHDCTFGFSAPWHDGRSSLPEATGGARYDIQRVRAGSLSMTEAINGFVLDEYCTPYIY